MSDYEIRPINKQITDEMEKDATGIAPLGNATTEGDNAMIAETEAQTIARAQHWDDVSDSITVAQSKTPCQQQLDKWRMKHQERLEAGAHAFVMECNAPFDPIACRAQFESECI